MNYIVLSELGQGGMANVYLASHKNLGTEFAIKILDKRFISDDNIRKRFLAEARIMSRMNHPNVIRVSDLIDEPETVAFVMEYIPGETLKQHIDRMGKLDVNAVKMLFSQMLAATKYIHELGLIHRDIKPSNFMVTPDGVIKLMDFGIAKVSDAASSEYTGTGASQQMGTPMYMSPEQVRSTGTVTAATDIYSLGVTLWQMVSGTKPYDTASLSLPEIQVAILREDLPLTGTIWDPVIQKATRKNVEERFKNDKEFLEAIHNPSTLQTKPAEPTPKTPEATSEFNPVLMPPRKKSKLVPILVIVGFLLGLSMIYILNSEESEVEEMNFSSGDEYEAAPAPIDSALDPFGSDFTSADSALVVVPEESEAELEQKRLEREERKRKKEEEVKDDYNPYESPEPNYGDYVKCARPGCKAKTSDDHPTINRFPYEAYCSWDCYYQVNGEEEGN
jgi:serine/threonine-protein kinase